MPQTAEDPAGFDGAAAVYFWGVVGRLLFRAFVKVHVALYRARGGRLGGRLGKGVPVLLLTTTGRKTGKRRTTPLLYVEEADRYVVVASVGGAPSHPAWYLNLRSNPAATIQVGGRKLAVTAETAGLKERARAVVAGLHAATAPRVLLAYFAIRQITAALGLTSLGGHAQMVRPLIAPMAEGAAENQYGELPQSVRYKIRAHAAAVDNIALFFGEDIFIAIGSILLIRGFLDQNGIHVEPTQLAIWAIPTAICAFVIHCTRLLLLDRQLRAELEQKTEQA
jgi:deazaflavin-dependent oxidoreductase (nitroreductase family)